MPPRSLKPRGRFEGTLFHEAWCVQPGRRMHHFATPGKYKQPVDNFS